MSKNTHWTAEDMKRKGLIQDAIGNFVPVKSLVAKKVEKLPSLIEQCKPYVNQQTEALLRMKMFKEQGLDPIPIGNKKVKNATKIEENGIKFDSRLEKYMYDLLRGAQIDFEFQKTYTLQEKFRYRGEAVRAITLTVDFWLPTRNMIIDTKGHQTQQGAVRWKILKSVLKHIEDSQPEIIMPKNKEE